MIDDFGFIRNKLEIKILILFILRRLPEPISFEALTELTMCDENISYFEFADCVSDLVKNGNLIVVDDKYTLTQKGARNSEITEINLPYSIREKAEKKSSALRSAQSRNAMIKTAHDSLPDSGCKVKLSLSDGMGEIVSMELLAANEKQAISLENGFRKNAEKIYNKLIEMILE
ncbi:MAG: DUF4364 family protein [Oscillospiraceae bacterium]|nr:DUF4364 family protein [Oscillospiraceae bacterium]